MIVRNFRSFVDSECMCIPTLNCENKFEDGLYHWGCQKGIKSLTTICHISLEIAYYIVWNLIDTNKLNIYIYVNPLSPRVLAIFIIMSTSNQKQFFHNISSPV